MKVVKKEIIGIQPVFSTNVEKNMNYISEGGIINKNCVCDQNYQGEVHINLHNVSKQTQTIKAGEKIVQFLVLPINYCDLEESGSVEELYKDTGISDRGEGGFGSTGV